MGKEVDHTDDTRTPRTDECEHPDCTKPRAIWSSGSSRLCFAHKDQRRRNKRDIRLSGVCPHPDHDAGLVRPPHDVMIDGQWWCVEHCPIRGWDLVAYMSEQRQDA